jgi:hypothetical protein
MSRLEKASQLIADQLDGVVAQLVERLVRNEKGRSQSRRILTFRKQFSTRRILNVKLPEPGGGSMWSAEGNRASNTLTRRPATYHRIRIRARPCERDCAHEQSSANPVMSDANSIAESQQKPSDRPKHHPPREPILQVIGNLLQSFELSRGAGLDAPPFRRRTFH